MAALKVFSACNKNSARQTKGLFSIASFEVRFAFEKMLQALKKFCYKENDQYLRKKSSRMSSVFNFFWGGGVYSFSFVLLILNSIYS